MRRGVIPPGRAGLLVLIAALVPVAVAKCKPLAKQVGKGLVSLGEKLQEMAEEVVAEAKTAGQPAPETPKKAAAPKAKTAAQKPKATAKAKPRPPKPKARSRARKPKPAEGTA